MDSPIFRRPSWLPLSALPAVLKAYGASRVALLLLGALLAASPAAAGSEGGRLLFFLALAVADLARYIAKGSHLSFVLLYTAAVAMGEYVIKCRFQSNRTQRYIRLHVRLD